MLNASRVWSPDVAAGVGHDVGQAVPDHAAHAAAIYRGCGGGGRTGVALVIGQHGAARLLNAAAGTISYRNQRDTQPIILVEGIRYG